MSVLLVEKQDTLKTITLNRPNRGNALNQELIDEIHDEVKRSSIDDTRVMAVKGAGNSFCTGFDLSNLDDLSDDEIAARIISVESMLQAIHHAPFLTVALVHSNAFGAGADLVCSCHVRIAEPASQFCMPGLNFGIVLGTRRLAQRVGQDNAIGLLINTRIFKADEALRIGFLSAIAEKKTWADHVDRSLSTASVLERQNISRMLSVVVPDTRAEDMADLKESMREPGLVKRILEYRRSLRARSGKSPQSSRNNP